MKSVLAAEAAELIHFKSVRVILLVLFCVVISLLAFGANESNLDSCIISHDFGTSQFLIICRRRTAVYLPLMPAGP